VSSAAAPRRSAGGSPPYPHDGGARREAGFVRRDAPFAARDHDITLAALGRRRRWRLKTRPVGDPSGRVYERDMNTFAAPVNSANDEQAGRHPGHLPSSRCSGLLLLSLRRAGGWGGLAPFGGQVRVEHQVPRTNREGDDDAISLWLTAGA